MGNIHQINSSPNRDATMSKSLLNIINKKNNVKFPTAVSLCAYAATRMEIYVFTLFIERYELEHVQVLLPLDILVNYILEQPPKLPLKQISQDSVLSNSFYIAQQSQH